MPRGLDTYVGRKVLRIDQDENGNWFIELDGGIRITNLDPKFKSPNIPSEAWQRGITFAAIVLSDEQTQMVLANFGPSGTIDQEFRAAFNAIQYTIYDEGQALSPYAPQAGNVPVKIPPHPEGREYPGPIVDERTKEALESDEEWRGTDPLHEEPKLKETPPEQPKKVTKAKKSGTKKSTKKPKQ